MAIYKFEQIEAEVENPTIEIIMDATGPRITNIDFVNKTYSIEIRLITETSTFRVVVEEVETPSLNFDEEGGNLVSQVTARLNSKAYLVTD